MDVKIGEAGQAGSGAGAGVVLERVSIQPGNLPIKMHNVRIGK